MMLKIWLIIKREFLVRVRKKSFIVMTILGPILIAALMIVPIYLAKESQDQRLIAVNNQEKFNLDDSEFLRFSSIPEIEAFDLSKDFSKSAYYALLYIKDSTFTIYSNQQISLIVSKEIERQIEKIIEINNLKAAGINPTIIENAKTEIKIITKVVDENGISVNSHSEASMGIGFMAGLLIYMFIFMYGTMVMRGVIEEKTSRIVEVIISSVKPFQLMMGKILGVALVGLTQFILWILLTIIISTVAELWFLDSTIDSVASSGEQSIILAQIANFTGGINLTQIFYSFILYFLFGYLMYSSLFAAVGSAVDAEADTQQFILPVTIPLILSFILIQPIIDNPDGSLAFWMSVIPFTSPIIMMVRLPFGVATWELLLSMAILVSTFITTTWIAGKIYRTGILMYGKKVSYKELWKWLKY